MLAVFHKHSTSKVVEINKSEIQEYLLKDYYKTSCLILFFEHTLFAEALFKYFENKHPRILSMKQKFDLVKS